MLVRGWSIMLALALVLAGCGSDNPLPGEREAAGAAPPATATVSVSGPERRILAFGDSLFAGYGLADGEGYPDVLQAALRARGINARVIDSGVSGDTSAAGRQRLAYVLDGLEPKPDLALVELGGNDLLRGVPPAETRRNLEAILAELDAREIPVLLMGMRAPPNLGQAYVAEFDAIYPALAERFDNRLVPFFLEPVYDRPALIQGDRIHPTAQGIRALVAATADAVVDALPPAD